MPFNPTYRLTSVIKSFSESTIFFKIDPSLNVAINILTKIIN